MFFSKGDAFIGLPGYLASGLQATLLDTRIFVIYVETIQVISDIEFLRVKKNLLIKQCVQKYCIEDCKLVDIFSNGYVAELGLALEKEVICLVESIEDQRKLETRLITFAKPRNEEPDQSNNDNQRPSIEERLRRGEVLSAADFLDVEDSM